MPQPKPVNFRLIERPDDQALYGELDRLVQQYHPELTGAVILLYWRSGWRPDADYLVTLAQVQLATDRERELREHDLSIALNQDHWHLLDPQQRLAVIDTELTRVTRSKDKEGEEREDEHGRPVWRLRRYEAGTESVRRRHGLSLMDIQADLSTKLAPQAEEGSHVAVALGIHCPDELGKIEESESSPGGD